MRKADIVKKQTQDYKSSLSSIIKKVEESKHKAITTVNRLLIELYWFTPLDIFTALSSIKFIDMQKNHSYTPIYNVILRGLSAKQL